MSRSDKPIPEVLIEQLALGEISAEDERFLRAELEPAELERRLTNLRSLDAEFSLRTDPEQQVTSIEARVRIARAQNEAKKSTKTAARYWLPSLAAAACALLWIARPPSTPLDTARIPVEDTVRMKGFSSHLVLYRRVGERADALAAGAHTKPGDMLQIGYVAADAKHGVIFSLDGGGAVTLHYPENERASTLLETEGEQLLEFAYELDAAPRFERFFFVTGATPIDVSALLQTARNLARNTARAEKAHLPVASNLTQYSLTLVKE